MLIILLVCLPPLAMSDDMPAFLDLPPAEKIEKNPFNPREHHWLWIFDFEGLKYEVPYEYDGVQRNFNPSKQELWGGRLGFGRELYLGNGFLTTARVEGYYVGTLYPKTNGDESSFYKKTGQLWGGDFALNLSYLHHIETKNPIMEFWSSLTMEPFLEAGIGRGYAYNRLNYHTDTGPTGVQEDYRQTVEDILTIFRIGGGINFAAGNGFFFFTKVYVNNYDVIKRTTDTFTRPNHGTGTSVHASDKNVSLDPSTVIAIGGGYKF